MTNGTRVLVLTVCMALAATGVATAQSLTIYTEDNSPLQTMKDGVLTGLSVEVVQEIQKRVGNTDAIQLVPWARGYVEVQKKPNVMLFSTGRTIQREPLFQWVGPLFETQYAFFSRTDSKLVIKTLEDAKKVTAVGVVLNDVRDQYLTGQGFANLDKSDIYATMFKKLLAGRVDLAVGSVTSIDTILAQAGGKASDVKAQFVFLKAQLYLAFSKDTDAAIVKKWAAALDLMKKDGSYAKIFRKYFPVLELPGPATAPVF